MRRGPEPLCDVLDADRVRLRRDDTGHLRLTIEGDRCYLDVKVVRAFPHSIPDRYLGLMDARGGDQVISVIVDPGEMDPESRQAAADALVQHYFIPVISRVVSLKEEFGAVYIDVETDHGPRHFIARGLRDGMEQLGDGELLIPDVDGNRYRIADWRRLDGKSRRLLERVV